MKVCPTLISQQVINIVDCCQCCGIYSNMRIGKMERGGEGAHKKII